MSENHNGRLSLDVDTAFLRSRRGIVKVAEVVTLLVALVCFSVAATQQYIAATVLEFLITVLLLMLYFLKLNKRLTFFFWPLVDVFNSVFAAIYLMVLSLMAVTTYTVAGTLVGGIVSLVSAGLFCLDGFTLFKNITFNRPRNGNQDQDKQ